MGTNINSLPEYPDEEPLKGSDNKRSIDVHRSHDLIMRAVSVAAEEFLQTPDLDLSIQEALGKLGEITGSSRVYIYQNEWLVKDELGSCLRFNWNSLDTLTNANCPLAKFPFASNGLNRWMEMLSENRIIEGYISEFPDIEREFLDLTGIKWTAIFPITVELDWWGFLGFDTVVNKRPLYPDELEAMRIAADILGAALHRQNVEAALQESRKRFRTIADFTHDWEYWISPEGKFLYSSPSFKTITDYVFDYFSPDTNIFQKIVHPEDYKFFSSHLNHHLIYPSNGAIEFRIITREGEVRWISHVCCPIFETDGKFLGQRASNRDVTSQKKIEEKLNETNQSLNETVKRLENINKHVSLLNEMGKILQASSKIKDIYDSGVSFAGKLFPQQRGALYIWDENSGTLTLANHFGEKTSFPESLPSSNSLKFAKSERHFVSGEKNTIIIEEFTEIIGKGDPTSLCVPLVVQEQLLGLFHFEHIPEKELKSFSSMAFEVAERIALSLANINLREKLRIESIRDALTGLYNRRYMEEVLNKEIHRADRHSHSLVIMLMDIDHFKRFNDMFGHAAGDEVLKRVSITLQTQTRNEDIVCRFGGEEFLIIMTEIQKDIILQRAEFLRQNIKDLKVKYREQELESITVSVGVAIYDGNGSLEELLRAVDKALYSAKNAGRDRVMSAI